MSSSRLFLALLLLKNSELLQALAGQRCLLKLALTLTILAMLVQNLQEVFGDEL